MAFQLIHSIAFRLAHFRSVSSSAVRWLGTPGLGQACVWGMMLLLNAELATGQPSEAAPADSAGVTTTAREYGPTAAAGGQPSEVAPPNSAPASNTAPENGLPTAAAESQTPTGELERPARPWRRDGEMYPDVYAAWGWNTSSYLIIVSPFNYYLHDEGHTFGFIPRMFGLGAMSFQRTVAAIGGTPTTDRRYSLVIEAIDPNLRIYLGPVYLDIGANLGLAFYDSLVPRLDGQLGVGFEYHGWGLETGLRTNRLPRDVVFVSGGEFSDSTYSLQLYVALPMNVQYL